MWRLYQKVTFFPILSLFMYSTKDLLLIKFYSCEQKIHSPRITILIKQGFLDWSEAKKTFTKNRQHFGWIRRENLTRTWQQGARGNQSVIRRPLGTCTLYTNHVQLSSRMRHGCWNAIFVFGSSISFQRLILNFLANMIWHGYQP